MKKIVLRIVGAITASFGVYTMIFSGYQVYLGQWIWLPIALACGAIMMCGIRVIQGDKPKEILRDLLFVLVRTH